MLDWLWQKYEQGKARLFQILAEFFALKGKILELRKRAGRVLEKTRATRDPLAMKAAQSVADQVEQLYMEHAAAEGKLGEAQRSVSTVESSKTESGLGILPVAALAGAASVIVAAVSAVLIVRKKYDYLARTLDGLERKTLTPAEYKIAVGGADFGIGTLFQGTTGILLLGGIAVGAWYLLGRRR